MHHPGYDQVSCQLEQKVTKHPGEVSSGTTYARLYSNAARNQPDQEAALETMTTDSAVGGDVYAVPLKRADRTKDTLMVDNAIYQM